ncbi:hypothetical protein A7A08_00291 [Methyloligella halotolerans]|uniref:Uncharacterized protein n=1 Tax=Methyloligella halotolerans TaxID=1177755 RepID=A0A1E2S289_9HYPH|nr:hypothetical protein [Methyloligella halotolerans]ODA68468.1 hypothetical protein A7A08_00291 [Methyloligella halotolerans]
MLVSRTATFLIAAIAFALVSGGSAYALPLDKEACDQLKAKHDAKLTPEIKDALDHGPDWVKTNLDAAKLDQVREYLVLEERLEFQCRKGRYIKKYWDMIPLPIRRPEPPVQKREEEQRAEHTPQHEAGQRVVSTSQARID